MPEVYFSDDELMHYGVLGMKWGKRKSSGSSSSKKNSNFRKAIHKTGSKVMELNKSKPKPKRDSKYKNISEDGKKVYTNKVQIGTTFAGAALGTAFGRLAATGLGVDYATPIGIGITAVGSALGAQAGWLAGYKPQTDD